MMDPKKSPPRFGPSDFVLRSSFGLRPSAFVILRVIAAGLAPLLASAQEDGPFTRLFDTGAPLTVPLTAEMLSKRPGWAQVPEDNLTYQFSGDTVLQNDKLALVFKKHQRGPEIYTRTATGLKQIATLGHAPELSSGIGSLEAIKIIENNSAGVFLETTFKNGGSAVLRFRLTTGEAILQIVSTDGHGFIDLQAKTRFVVVPDYFGDDLIYGPEAFQGLCLPAENFCLNLVDGGDSIIMSVWQSNEQDAWLVAASDAGQSHGSDRIRCLKNKSNWLAFLESPRIWHFAPVARASAPASSGGVLPPVPSPDPWAPPFPAKWRSSFVRSNFVADSWEMDHGPSREQDAASHQGPLIIYPIDRSTSTPLTITCPTDVMRNTLGVGPCQYILACEGLASQGDPTPNSVMIWVEKQFEQKKDAKVAEDIKERLNQMVQHIADAQSRLQRYTNFAAQVREVLSAKPSSEPFRPIVQNLSQFAAAGLTSNSSPERAGQLAGQVSALVGSPNALPACQRLGGDLRSIGAAQDRALAKSRMMVRALQAQSLSLAASKPALAALPRDLQQLAQQMLKNKP